MQRPSNSDNQSGNSLYQSSATEIENKELKNENKELEKEIKELENEIKRLKYENTIKKNTIKGLKLKMIVDGQTNEGQDEFERQARDSERQLREKIDDLEVEIKKLKQLNTYLVKETISADKLNYDLLNINPNPQAENYDYVNLNPNDAVDEIKRLKIENTHLKIENTHLIKVLESTEKLKHGLPNSVILNTNDKIVPLGAQSINNLYDNNIKENSRLKYINALQEGTMPKSYFKTPVDNREIQTVPKMGNSNTTQSAIQ